MRKETITPKPKQKKVGVRVLPSALFPKTHSSHVNTEHLKSLCPTLSLFIRSHLLCQEMSRQWQGNEQVMFRFESESELLRSETCLSVFSLGNVSRRVFAEPTSTWKQFCLYRDVIKICLMEVSLSMLSNGRLPLRSPGMTFIYTSSADAQRVGWILK